MGPSQPYLGHKARSVLFICHVPEVRCCCCRIKLTMRDSERQVHGKALQAVTRPTCWTCNLNDLKEGPLQSTRAVSRALPLLNSLSTRRSVCSLMLHSGPAWTVAAGTCETCDMRDVDCLCMRDVPHSLPLFVH